ncbi:hypothetical protein D3C71_1597710 [compost metagenome]
MARGPRYNRRGQQPRPAFSCPRCRLASGRPAFSNRQISLPACSARRRSGRFLSESPSWTASAASVCASPQCPEKRTTMKARRGRLPPTESQTGQRNRPGTAKPEESAAGSIKEAEAAVSASYRYAAFFASNPGMP